jgi:prevent-host-death family protein
MEIDVEQAKIQFSDLLDRVVTGEDVVITVAGEPVAKLVAIASEQPGFRSSGSAKGQFTVPDDFNDPLPKEIGDLFYGE